MATTRSGIINLEMTPKFVDTDYGTISQTFKYAVTWLEGLAAMQLDLAYSRPRTVSTGTPDDIDLNGGGLTDVFGNAFNAVKIPAFGVINDSANTLTVGGSGNTFSAWLTGTNPGVVLPAGAGFFIFNPTLAAYAVSAGVSDLLRITAGAGTGNKYRPMLWGRSA